MRNRRPRQARSGYPSGDDRVKTPDPVRARAAPGVRGPCAARACHDAAMTGPIAELLEVLDLERHGADVFVGQSHRVTLARMYGGQVAAQALVACGRTVDTDRRVHSLHAYFLRPGDPREPVRFTVERIRDGRSFSVRRVLAEQRGRTTFALSASFHVGEATGPEHTTRAPEVPDPMTLPTWNQLVAPQAHLMDPFFQDRRLPIEVRPVRGIGERLVAALGEEYADHPSQRPTGDRPAEDVAWFRSDGPMPADPLLHEAVAAYVSDTTLLDAVARRHGGPIDFDGSAASLDHAMWFHRPFRADLWTLYVTQSPVAQSGRGFARGRMFDAAGDLVVSVTQEGLFRPRNG